jgi:hypoxanthine phosphoribosyltransferase
VLAHSDCLAGADAVRLAVGGLARRINADLGGRALHVLPLLNGALPFAGMLLPQLDMPLRLSAIHVGRYGDGTRGQTLQWRAPLPEVEGDCAPPLDDVLDEGITLDLVRAAVLAAGARQCLTAVLAEKNPQRRKPLAADYVALEMPDRFLFGMGMDAYGWWRNLPAHPCPARGRPVSGGA